MNEATGRRNSSKVSECVCDVCSKTFERVTTQLCSEYTFCSRECKKKADGTLLLEKRKATVMSRYGVAHAAQIPGSSEKMVATRLERTGAKGPFDRRSSSYEKKRTTTQERHGVPHHFLLDRVRDSRARAFQERYGEPHANPSKYMTHEQLVKAGQRGYAVQHGKHKRVSKPEAALGAWLAQRYRKSEVVTPILLNGKLVDFYVRCLNTYVELDGVFWHGLDRPLEQVTNEGVLKRYREDRVLDAHCTASGIRLVRVTDLEWNACAKRDAYEPILKKLEG